MTWEQYWYESPVLILYYHKANKERLKQLNHINWMNGAYIRQAIVSAFDSKNKTKYPDEPYQLFPKTEEEIERDNKRKNAEIREALNSLKRRWDARQKDKEQNTPETGGEDT